MVQPKRRWSSASRGSLNRAAFFTSAIRSLWSARIPDSSLLAEPPTGGSHGRGGGSAAIRRGLGQRDRYVGRPAIFRQRRICLDGEGLSRRVLRHQEGGRSGADGVGIMRCGAKDLGGTLPRRIHYYPTTGRVVRRLLGVNERGAVGREENDYGRRLLRQQQQQPAGEIELFGDS